MSEHRARWECKTCGKHCTVLTWEKEEPPNTCQYWHIVNYKPHYKRKDKEALRNESRNRMQ